MLKLSRNHVMLSRNNKYTTFLLIYSSVQPPKPLKVLTVPSKAQRGKSICGPLVVHKCTAGVHDFMKWIVHMYVTIDSTW